MPGSEGRRLELQKRVAALQRRGYSIRATLAALIALVLVPTLLFGAWLASQAADAQRTYLEDHAQREARELIAAMDRELLNARNILVALSGSPHLRTGDIEGFRNQAVDVARRLGVQIILREPAGSGTLINTKDPTGQRAVSRVPHERVAAEEQAIASGNMVVSNVFMGPLSEELVAAVIVPAAGDGGRQYVLSISMPASKFHAVVMAMLAPENWITTIYDHNTVIVARSVKNEEFAGTRIRSDEPARLTTETSSGSSVTRDGLEYSWFRRQSPVTGWFVSIGVPQSALSAAARRAFLTYGIAGSVLLLGGLGLAYFVGGRLAQSAGALGIDRTPTRDEFRVLFEFAPNGVVVVDSDDNIALVNEQMETMFRYRREELIGRSIKSLIPERMLGNYGKPGLTTARRAKVSGAWRDLRGRRKDGTEFPIELGLNPISTPGGNMVIATMVDITARQEAAERLANMIAERDDLRRRLMQAQEDERLRLAHELHDQTGQSLTAVMLQLKSVESTTTEEGRDRLRLLRKQLEEMGKTLHRVAWELRPASIDELGLSSALTNHVADWSAQTGIEADFHCRDTRLDRLPEEVRTTVYRVVQEALTNIAKHASGTTSVSVVLDRSEGILRLTIEDDGLGFDPTSPNERDRRGGLGIAGMRERLALIGGELVVESSVGVGTTIFARVPLEHERLIA